MILKVFTQGDGPDSRLAIEVAHRISDEDLTVEYFDLDEAESDSMRELYDIYRNPTFVVTQNDGKLIEIWQGEVPSESAVKNFMRL